jgi:hypothetical protein
MDAEITRTHGPMSNQDAILELENLIETIKLDRATVTQINVKKQYIGMASGRDSTVFSRRPEAPPRYRYEGRR